MKTFLPDHGLPVAGWRKERGHRRIEKSCREDKEGDLNILEGNRGSRLGGEMGGRGVDYVLEKVFNPARNWMRGRWTPDSASTRKIPYREFSSKNRLGEFSAEWDPHKNSNISCGRLTGEFILHFRLYPLACSTEHSRDAYEPPGFQWTSAGKFHVISGTITTDCLQPEPVPPRQTSFARNRW